MKNRSLVLIAMAAMLAMFTGCVGINRQTATKNPDGTCTGTFSSTTVGLQLPTRAPNCTSCKTVPRNGQTAGGQVVVYACPYHPQAQGQASMQSYEEPMAYSTAPAPQRQVRRAIPASYQQPMRAPAVRRSSYQQQGPRIKVYYFPERGDDRPYDRFWINGKWQYRLHQGPVEQIRDSD